jgi:hypothetical protein
VVVAQACMPLIVAQREDISEVEHELQALCLAELLWAPVLARPQAANAQQRLAPVRGLRVLTFTHAGNVITDVTNNQLYYKSRQTVRIYTEASDGIR